MASILSTPHIIALRQEAAQQVAIEIVRETGSTNADLLARIGNLQGPTLLAAEMQTAGRGRAGRPWYSTAGTGLTFSLAWKFERPIHGLSGLPLAAGVAIADALIACGAEVRLKWPNDVLLQGRKLAGILIETAKAEQPTHSWAVTGVGVNIAIPEEAAARIGQAAAQMPDPKMDRNLLLAELLNRMASAMIRFNAEGLAPFIDRWHQLHAYAGQQVAIIDRGELIEEGEALGITGDGCLLLDTAEGRKVISAGDVSLRIREG